MKFCDSYHCTNLAGYGSNYCYWHDNIDYQADECPICLEEDDRDETGFYHVQCCQKTFHRSCLINHERVSLARKSQPNCPTCRYPLIISEDDIDYRIHDLRRRLKYIKNMNNTTSSNIETIETILTVSEPLTKDMLEYVEELIVQ